MSRQSSPLLFAEGSCGRTGGRLPCSLPQVCRLPAPGAAAAPAAGTAVASRRSPHRLLCGGTQARGGCRPGGCRQPHAGECSTMESAQCAQTCFALTRCPARFMPLFKTEFIGMVQAQKSKRHVDGPGLLSLADALPSHAQSGCATQLDVQAKLDDPVSLASAKCTHEQQLDLLPAHLHADSMTCHLLLCRHCSAPLLALHAPAAQHGQQCHRTTWSATSHATVVTCYLSWCRHCQAPLPALHPTAACHWQQPTCCLSSWSSWRPVQPQTPTLRARLSWRLL